MIVSRSLVAGLFAAAMSFGCKMAAPIHVWQPPLIESTVGKRVVVSEVVGPSKITEPLSDQLVRSAPQDSGRATTISHSANLQHNQAIRLVSATDDEPSDIALSAAAMDEGFDFVLRGEVLEDRGANAGKSDRLTVSWRLAQLGQDGTTGGMPVVVDRESAVARYPDLAFVGDQNSLLMTAAVRDTYRLITPSVARDEVELDIPYVLPGSRAVRAGNLAALNGRWAEAKQIWSEVAEKYPVQVAAIHNLAVAAAAEQDFSSARQLARSAIRRQPTLRHKTTAEWIELRQRDYHNSFGLPDPPEGWFITNNSASD